MHEQVNDIIKELVTQQRELKAEASLIEVVSRQAKEAPLQPYADYPDLIHYQLEQPYELAVDTIVGQNKTFVSRLAKSHYGSVIRHYHFIARQLQTILEEHEGMGVGSDAPRWLILTYLKSLEAESNPTMPSPRTYKQPKQGDLSLWFEFIEACLSFYSGNPKPYQAVSQLIHQAYTQTR